MSQPQSQSYENEKVFNLDDCDYDYGYNIADSSHLLFLMTSTTIL